VLECLLLSPGGLKDGELPVPVIFSQGEQTLLLISQPEVQPVLYLDCWKAFSLVLVDSKMASFLSLYSPARVNRLSSSSLNLRFNQPVFYRSSLKTKTFSLLIMPSSIIKSNKDYAHIKTKGKVNEWEI
jgi:hypothetical protein